MNSEYIIFLVIIVLIVGFMIYSGRRNRARQTQLQEKMVPGVEVMTTHGIFGKLLSVDTATNVAEIETTPGTVIRVHRQTLSKVITPEEMDSSAPKSVEEAMERANREQAEREASARVDAEEPAYGERVEDPITRATSERKSRGAKKTDS